MKRVIRKITKTKTDTLYPSRRVCGTCEQWYTAKEPETEQPWCLESASPFYRKHPTAQDTCKEWREHSRFRHARAIEEHKQFNKKVDELEKRLDLKLKT